MKIINSYIFIPKKEDNNGNVIKLGEYFPTVFSAYFKATPTNDIKNVVSFNNRINTGDFKYKKMNIQYKILSVDSVYYLDIIIDGAKKNIISCLTDFNDIFLKEGKFNKKYIPIISYDYISEEYCNKVYPILNKFERKFRKLLFLIFTSNFKELYFEKMASEDLIKNVKGRIKNKNEEYRIQNYFYSVDIGMLREFLFDKQWTIIEEEKQNELLKQDFSKMTNDEIQKAIKDLEPKNNWDRFFNNKGFSEDIEESMSLINELRNTVAHNKLLNKNEYLLLKNNLVKLITEIDKAIKITESVDFMKINNDKIRKLFNNINSSISNIISQIAINEVSKTLDSFKNYFSAIIDERSKLTQAILESINTINKKDLK
jgi:hypothetical protein